MANIERLESTSTLLGLFDEWDCSMREQELSPGDLLALYTDGITEASDEQGEEFGERRLVEFLRQHRELSCQPLLTAIMDEVRRFSFGQTNRLLPNGRIKRHGLFDRTSPPNQKYPSESCVNVKPYRAGTPFPNHIKTTTGRFVA